MRRWIRPLFATALALVVYLQIESRYSTAEDQLASRLGRVLPTATALREIPAGTPLGSAPIGFPAVPVRWRQPGTFTTQRELDGLVSAVVLKAGTMLGPGTTEPESEEAARVLRKGERIVSTVATAPVGSLRPGMIVEVVITSPGRAAEIASHRAVLISAKPARDLEGSAGASKVQAELRDGESLALRIANAEAAGSEIRLVPAASPN